MSPTSIDVGLMAPWNPQTSFLAFPAVASALTAPHTAIDPAHVKTSNVLVSLTEPDPEPFARRAALAAIQHLALQSFRRSDFPLDLLRQIEHPI